MSTTDERKPSVLGGMQRVVGYDAEGNVDVEGESFAVHRQEHGVVACFEGGFGHAVVFVADYEANFFGVVKFCVGDGVVGQFDGDDFVTISA